MRLTQPFRTWQLAILLAVAIPAAAHAQQLDSVTRVQALERADFPRPVVLVGELPDTIDESEWEAALRSAVQTWNDVSCSYAEISVGDRAETAEEVAEGTTTVAFVDGATDDCFAIDENVGWTVLSNCGPWRSTAVLLNTNGFEWMSEPDPYRTDDRGVDVESVLVHELGHALGLLHEDVSDPLATMAPSYLRDGGLASLSAEDKLALCDLYPREVDECSTNASCAGRCITEGEFSVCDEVRVPTGSYCDLADLNCADGGQCLQTSPVTYSGYCTATCAADEDCPDDMACTQEQCRFIATPRESGGCSTAARPMNVASWLLLVVGLLVTRRRRT